MSYRLFIRVSRFLPLFFFSREVFRSSRSMLIPKLVPVSKGVTFGLLSLDLHVRVLFSQANFLRLHLASLQDCS